ncbi:MAG TPA: vitamin K epoxide reductase family protein [Solirubrobacteraceae bacterium]|nr:vitamin K epoxide reductase family protein [Solirubrobacteraceae bacterium]
MSRTLRRLMIVLAVIGIGLASYLTVIHYAGINPACTAGQSCVKVQTSVWSKVAGVPVALLGLIGYIAILGSLLAPDREESRLATLGLTVIGVGFSAYLTYRELFSIHAICEWCVSSAVVLTLLLIGAIVRYLTAPASLVAGSPPAGVYADDDEPYRRERSARKNGDGSASEHDSEDVAAR